MGNTGVRARLPRARWQLALLVLLFSTLAPIPAVGQQSTYSCKVTLGGPAGFDMRSIGFDGALGGCQLVILTAESTVTGLAVAEGCAARGDTDGDVSNFETFVATGDTYDTGTRIWAMCSATSVDRVNSITLESADAGSPPPAGWSTPTRVTTTNEPYVAIGDDGTVYIATYGKMHRSVDGGETWADISPLLPDAIPNVGGADTSVSIAPDNTVWFASDWGVLGGTFVCRSNDRGDTWHCNNVALPGVTDRMWILGLSASEAFLQTNQGFVLLPHWLYTNDGGDVFTPYATTFQAGVNSNMVMDSAGGMYQVMRDPSTLTLRLFRVEDKDGISTFGGADTHIPRAYNAPSIAIADDVLWIAGEPTAANGSRLLTANRSRDKGATWERIDVPITSESIAFGAVAAAPGGRIALAYYGSDKAGAPEANGGNWGMFVASTINGLSASPTWRITRLDPLVHSGNICAGALCGEKGSDVTARYAGDFLSVAIDQAGRIHAAFQSDAANGTPVAIYMHQLQAETPPTTTTTTTTAPCGKDKDKDKDKKCGP